MSRYLFAVLFIGLCAAAGPSAAPAQDEAFATAALYAGDVALADGQFMSALEAFARANALRNRTSPEAWLGMARASYGQGVFGESLRSADRALKHATDDPNLEAAIHHQRGLCLSAVATGPDDPRLSTRRRVSDR